ncbi:c-type cytochrome [Erythrobacter tepidarius]|uniref:c-type cytochrome n=1 Tax=Erythrobacter tepidarius TaxID=60454 RepID=UPI0013029C97|nr:cytochrome c [Erythrobacter tepidarius]
MLRTNTSRLVLAAALASCSGETPAEKPVETASADAASAEGGPVDVAAVLKQREANFEAIGDAFKAIRGQLEKDAPDFALIATKATDINARAQKIAGHFPVGTSTADGVKTEALPAIWEKPEEFKAAGQKLIDESAKLAELAKGGDKAAVGAQAMAMGGACKGCHDKFRLDDKK